MNETRKPNPINYTTTQGSRYTPGMDVKQVAAEIRKAIKAAVKAGYLPDLKASVKISRYSMGQEINVSIVACQQVIINAPAWIAQEKAYWCESWVDVGGRFTEEGQHILDTIKAIGSQYNRTRTSDQPDDYYNEEFGFNAEFDSDLTRQQFADAKAA